MLAADLGVTIPAGSHHLTIIKLSKLTRPSVMAITFCASGTCRHVPRVNIVNKGGTMWPWRVSLPLRLIATDVSTIFFYYYFFLVTNTRAAQSGGLGAPRMEST